MLAEKIKLLKVLASNDINVLAQDGDGVIASNAMIQKRGKQ